MDAPMRPRRAPSRESTSAPRKCGSTASQEGKRRARCLALSVKVRAAASPQLPSGMAAMPKYKGSQCSSMAEAQAVVLRGNMQEINAEQSTAGNAAQQRSASRQAVTTVACSSHASSQLALSRKAETRR